MADTIETKVTEKHLNAYLSYGQTITALVTPMNEDFSIDFKSFKSTLDYQLKAGVEGVVVLGTTGESPTIKKDRERRKLIGTTVSRLGGKTHIIVGTGTNDTAETVKNTKIAKSMGANSAMVVTPYYNKPNRSGLIAHFYKAADIMPIIIYDSNRSGRQIQLDEFVEIMKHPNIIGVKAASGDIHQIQSLIDAFITKRKFIWSGDDNLAIPVSFRGGNGVVSVASNLYPKFVKETMASIDDPKIYNLESKSKDLMKALFFETNPVPIKYMMWKSGLIKSPAVRLPLGPLQKESMAHLDLILKRYENLR